MRELKNTEIPNISGALIQMMGSWSMSKGSFTPSDNFKLSVTGSSVCELGGYVILSNKITDPKTGNVLFDGSSESFCLFGSIFTASAIESSNPANQGTLFTVTGKCS